MSNGEESDRREEVARRVVSKLGLARVDAEVPERDRAVEQACEEAGEDALAAVREVLGDVEWRWHTTACTDPSEVLGDEYVFALALVRPEAEPDEMEVEAK